MPGKKIYGLWLQICLLWAVPGMALSQDVIISVPASHIFNRTELNTSEVVMNTNGFNRWRTLLGLLNLIIGAEDPKIQAQVNSFQIVSGTTLPLDILQWRLLSIGGSTSITGGTIPNFQTLSTNERNWFNTALIGLSLFTNFTPGDVVFNFRINSGIFSNYAFLSGNYSVPIAHNYGVPSNILESNIIFTPATFNIILSIPPAISWMSGSSSRYFEVTSLSPYRSSSEYTFGNLGGSQLGHTVNMNLRARASSPVIQFTSSKNEQGTRPVSALRLSSNHSSLPTGTLTSSWQTFTNSPFAVTTGNRVNFTQDLSVSAQDLRNHFFEAGTYTFQLNREAADVGGSAAPGTYDTEVTIHVPSLSEIAVGAGGPNVNFEFSTLQQYNQGQSKVVPQQIKLSNNEGYELYVKSETGYFLKSGIQSGIGSDILQVGVDDSPVQVALSTTPQKIISDGSPVLDQDLDIRYTIPAPKAQSLVSEEKTTYSIDLIYSFTVH